MSIEVVINRRKALPIRAIPFVTGWMMPPDMIASSLAHTDPSRVLEKVVAYHLVTDSEFAPMLPKEWDGIETALQALSHKLRAEEKSDNQNFTAWRHESISLLPAGVFLWKDEFEEAFGLAFSEERLSWIVDRPGDRELNLTPLIPIYLRAAVAEGFPDLGAPNAGTRQSHDSDWLATVNQAARKFWGNADRDDRGTHPPKSDVVAWLMDQGFSESLANSAATIIRPKWAPVGRKPEE